MTRKHTRKRRPSPISCRPPKGRAEELRMRVAASGLSTNAFITECIFGRSRCRAAERQLLARLLDQTAQIEDQLHELSLAGCDDDACALEAAQKELAELRAALLTGMGRSP